MVVSLFLVLKKIEMEVGELRDWRIRQSCAKRMLWVIMQSSAYEGAVSYMAKKLGWKDI